MTPVGKRAATLPRMPGVDGLRAVAVIAVFVYHAHGGWLPGGFLGVDVFFVISGYLITSLLLAEFDASGRIALGHFWMRRARRLLPAVFLLIGGCLLAAMTVARGQVDLRGDALAAIFYVANWRFVFEHQSYFAQFGKPPLLRHLWSLAVEEQFYLLWPPLLALALYLRRRGTAIALVAAATLGSTVLMALLFTPGHDTSRVFFGTDTRAAPLLVGVLLAFAWRPGRWPRLAPGVVDAAGLAGLAGVLLAFVLVHDQGGAVYHGGFLVLGLFAALLLAATVHPAGSLGRALGRPVPRWIGERSYAIYLWHWPVIVLMPAAGAWTVALQAGTTVVLADSSYRYVELPIRQGALRRLPRPQASFALAGAAVVALVGLALVTPGRSHALPPGFTKTTLARSERARTHLVSLPQAAKPKPAFPRRGPILALGDSVLLGASTELSDELGPALRLDAVIARQADDTIQRLRDYRAEGRLPQRVIVHVGDNGPLYYRDWSRLKQALAGVPLVVLINVRVDQSWQGQVNGALREAVRGWRHATVADWYDVSARPGAVVDGTHTSPDGARLLAALLARALRSPHLGGFTR